MKRSNLMSLFSWTITHVSWLTMAFSPVALGKEAENFKTQKLKMDIQALGLNKKSTVSEFWNKSKFYIPGYAYADFEKFSIRHGQKIMPTMDVKSTKNSLGEEIPTLQINDNGKTTTVQLIGDKEKYVKINNQFFTEKEVQSPKVLLTKLIKNDPKLMKELNQEIKKNNYDLKDQQSRPFRSYSGLSRFNKQLWAAMTVQQRVAYIVEMRLLNEKATLVQEAFAAQNKKPKKTSAYESFKKYQAAWEFLVGDANAGKVYKGEHCINQGFIAKDSTAYNNADAGNERCNLDTIIQQNYQGNKTVKKAIDDCKAENKKPCNPLVYSFSTTTGKAFCSTPNDYNTLQRGTHFKGSCDSQARLSGKGKDHQDTFINVTGLRNYDEQNNEDNKGKDLTKINRDEAKKAIMASQMRENFAATQDYLMGMLKAGNNDALVKLLEKKEWSPELESELLKIQVAFEDNITKSMDKCSADLNINEGKAHEPNFRNACEQLHRRWLFTEKFMAEFKCPEEKNGGVITSNNKNGVITENEIEAQKYKGRFVNGTKACAKTPVPAPVVVPAEPVVCPEGSKPNKDQAKETQGQCLCDNLTTHTFAAGPNLPEECVKKPDTDISKVKCNDVPAMLSSGECLCENGQAPQAKEQGFFSKIFHTDDAKNDKMSEYECDSGINWWMVGGIAAGIGLLALLFKNKDKNTKCTNGGNPPDCIVNSQCPVGSMGTPPDKCFAAGQCPPRATTPFPDCLGEGQCPAGTTGTFPNCIGQDHFQIVSVKDNVLRVQQELFQTV